MSCYCNISSLLFLLAVGLGAGTTLAQEQIRRLPPVQVAVDEDILAALVDEPCRHFEAARSEFAARRFSQAAAHLRTATAYLRLEAARATAAGRVGLDAAVRELRNLAAATEKGRIQHVDSLQQAFARAHYALASHHCVKSAHRCCRPAAHVEKGEMHQAGRDLRAASIHLDRGMRWARIGQDEDTQRVIQTSRLAAEKLLKSDLQAHGKAQEAIHSLHSRLEKLTGRKIMLARPLTPDDKTGPSIFR